MARRRHKFHGKRGLLPKRLGGWVGFVTKIGGSVLVSSPLIRAAADAFGPGNAYSGNLAGQAQYFPTRILFYYTGVDSNNNYALNPAILGGSIASVAGGMIIIKIGSLLSKWIK